MKKRYSRIRVNVKRSHSVSMLRNLLFSLLKHGSIVTTSSRSRMLKQYADKEIAYAMKTKDASAEKQVIAHVGSVHAARMLLLYREFLQGNNDEVQSGYVSIVKIGFRSGDNALKAEVSLRKKVDYVKFLESKLAKKAKKKKPKKVTKIKKEEKKTATAQVDSSPAAQKKAEVKKKVEEKSKTAPKPKDLTKKPGPVLQGPPERRENFFARLGDRILGRRVQGPTQKGRSTARSGI